MDKPPRPAAIKLLAPEMQDFALLDWDVVAEIVGFKDVAYARRKLKAAGLATVHVSERRDRPTVKALREFLQARQAQARGD